MSATTITNDSQTHKCPACKIGIITEPLQAIKLHTASILKGTCPKCGETSPLYLEVQKERFPIK